MLTKKNPNLQRDLLNLSYKCIKVKLMEDLRRNQAQTHSGCYLKYGIIYIKNLEDENFAEDDIAALSCFPPSFKLNLLTLRGYTENMLSDLAVITTTTKQPRGKFMSIFN